MEVVRAPAAGGPGIWRGCGLASAHDRGALVRSGRESIVALEVAAVAIASLDVTAGTRMTAISGFLLRSEAVSSSKIEHVDANRDDTPGP